ncbi:hypothetical protein [Tunicatimonas pelagia]|uniref:hypothetical protein n=1 Tax=Tunicatimonas pelagia TaxID=931531 RepID=UPI002666F54C|nr:hypothetical protein [Tunicatimonas pelagia]WKN41428.1 hypothetical protein P0M28_20540 [Tunicatimonas pelagia]
MSQEQNDHMDSFPDKMNIFEKGISEESFNEFYKILGGIGNADEKYKNDLISAYRSSPKSCSEQEVKKALVLLSKKGDVQSYRLIERTYNENQNLSIKNIALVALRNARMYLESELMDEQFGIISTGLGGEGNKLRYYLAFRPRDREDCLPKGDIFSRMESLCSTLKSKVENVEEVKGCYLFKILLPTDLAVGVLAEGFIEKNELLLDSYFCTNVEKPDDAQIESWIEDYG